MMAKGSCPMDDDETCPRTSGICQGPVGLRHMLRHSFDHVVVRCLKHTLVGNSSALHCGRGANEAAAGRLGSIITIGGSRPCTRLQA